jgi:hypothetical protein
VNSVDDISNTGIKKAMKEGQKKKETQFKNEVHELGLVQSINKSSGVIP